MKKIVKIVLVTIMMIATTGQAFAQPQQDKKQEQQRMSREQFAEMQARHIADEMAFDDATTKKFVDAYLSCQKEVWAIHPQRPQRDKDNKQQSMTEEQTEKAIKERFEQSQKLLDIRQKYYAKYSKFLTQKQIERVYQLEQKMMRKLDKRHDKRKGNRNGNPDARPRPQQNQQK